MERILRFHFVGKSGVDRAIKLDDPQLARIVRETAGVPGRISSSPADQESLIRVALTM